MTEAAGTLKALARPPVMPGSDDDRAVDRQAGLVAIRTRSGTTRRVAS
jgi:hypothetical protein